MHCAYYPLLPELIIETYSYLGCQEAAVGSRVCKTWHSALNSKAFVQILSSPYQANNAETISLRTVYRTFSPDISNLLLLRTLYIQNIPHKKPDNLHEKRDMPLRPKTLDDLKTVLHEARSATLICGNSLQRLIHSISEDCTAHLLHSFPLSKMHMKSLALRILSCCDYDLSRTIFLSIFSKLVEDNSFYTNIGLATKAKNKHPPDVSYRLRSLVTFLSPPILLFHTSKEKKDLLRVFKKNLALDDETFSTLLKELTPLLINQWGYDPGSPHVISSEEDPDVDNKIMSFLKREKINLLFYSLFTLQSSPYRQLSMNGCPEYDYYMIITKAFEYGKMRLLNLLFQKRLTVKGFRNLFPTIEKRFLHNLHHLLPTEKLFYDLFSHVTKKNHPDITLPSFNTLFPYALLDVQITCYSGNLPGMRYLNKKRIFLNLFGPSKKQVVPKNFFLRNAAYPKFIDAIP